MILIYVLYNIMDQKLLIIFEYGSAILVRKLK